MTDEVEARAAWDSAYITALPDSAFACVDDEGRHYPHHDRSGALDLPHLRNALSRIAQGGTTTCGRDHLEAHARAQDMGNRVEHADPVEIPVEAIQVRSLDKRELDIRMLPWNTVIDTASGLEEFRSGAFADASPDDVFLMGLEHEAHLGLGQNGQPVVVRHPVGKAIALDDRPDAQYGTFRVAKTARGDEVLALAAEGLVKGASVEWAPVPNGSVVEDHRGRRKTVHSRARLTGVSTTYRPAYAEAGVVAVRSDHKEDAPVADDKAALAATPEEPPAEPVQVTNVVDLSEFRTQFSEAMSGALGPLVDRLASVEERARSAFQIPTEIDQAPPVTFGEWTKTVFQLLTGDRIPEQHMRVVQELITTDNAGVVPEAFIGELRGVIDSSRPFMQTTRRLPTPSAGTSIRVPIITQRPTVALQAAEKDELASQKTIIGSDTFEMVTKGGVGDLSLQLLKRSDPSFLDLYVRLLAEAYAIESDDEAVHELIDAVGNVQSANALNPNSLSLGAAFQTSFDAIRRPPDTIWMSTEALAEFIDAKASGTNAPLYSNISTNMTAANPIQGQISGLRVVHVPALDAHGAYAVVGPSNGFAWAEDGTYTLQVDVPSKAGRDVALVGMLWFIPWYPEAFSLYNVAS
jgi:phage head maturation protease